MVLRVPWDMGRNTYDFTEGTMVFSKPNQVLSSEDKKVADDARVGYYCFIQIFFENLKLRKTIGNYTFFDYEVNEALHLSEAEKAILTDLVLKIEVEINQNIDKHSQKINHFNS